MFEVYVCGLGVWGGVYYLRGMFIVYVWRWLYVICVCLCYFQRRCMSGESRCGGVCMGLVYGRRWLYVCYLKVVCYCISPLVVIEGLDIFYGGDYMYVCMNLCMFEVILCYIWRFYVIYALFWCYMNVIFLWFFVFFLGFFSGFGGDLNIFPIFWARDDNFWNFGFCRFGKDGYESVDSPPKESDRCVWESRCAAKDMKEWWCPNQMRSRRWYKIQRGDWMWCDFSRLRREFEVLSVPVTILWQLWIWF